MRALLQRLRCAALAPLVLAAFVRAAASAEAAPLPEAKAEPRWTPSLALGISAQAHYATGKSSNSFADRAFFASRTEDRSVVLMPVIPVSTELAGPSLPVLPGSPRPFVRAGFQQSVDFDRTIARQGSIPKPVVLPTGPPGRLTADGIGGQGTLLVAEFEHAWFAGIGLQWSEPLASRSLQIKTSLDYFGQDIQLEGHVVHVSGQGPGETAPFATQRLDGRASRVLHAIGPRLALEVEVGSAGPFGFSTYLETATFFAIGNRSEEFEAHSGSDRASFAFEADSWITQAGVGVRVRWEEW